MEGRDFDRLRRPPGGPDSGSSRPRESGPRAPDPRAASRPARGDGERASPAAPPQEARGAHPSASRWVRAPQQPAKKVPVAARPSDAASSSRPRRLDPKASPFDEGDPDGAPQTPQAPRPEARHHAEPRARREEPPPAQRRAPGPPDPRGGTGQRPRRAALPEHERGDPHAADPREAMAPPEPNEPAFEPRSRGSARRETDDRHEADGAAYVPSGRGAQRGRERPVSSSKAARPSAKAAAPPRGEPAAPEPVAKPKAKPQPKPKRAKVVAEDEDRPTVEGPIVAPESIAGRSLTMVIAIMTFLCALLIGGVILIERAADAWSTNVLDEITVTVLPLDGDPLADRLTRVAALLSDTPGVEDVRIVPAAESEALLRPWLGDTIDLAPLPVPRLVTARRNGSIDAETLRGRIGAVAGASLDDHTAWSERLSGMASAAAGGAIGALILMLAATCISIVFATRSAIATNAATVEVLSALGAEDRFIVRAFRRRFVGIGARGALLGLAVALVLFGALDLYTLVSSAARSVQSRALFGDPSIGVMGYIMLVAVAVGVTVLVAFTSARSVRRHLEQMDM